MLADLLHSEPLFGKRVTHEMHGPVSSVGDELDPLVVLVPWVGLTGGCVAELSRAGTPRGGAGEQATAGLAGTGFG